MDATWTFWRRFENWLLLALALLFDVGVLMVARPARPVLAAWPWSSAAFLGVGILLLFLASVIDCYSAVCHP